MKQTIIALFFIFFSFSFFGGVVLADDTNEVGADSYRFGKPVDTFQSYSNGAQVPHRMSPVERKRPDGTWENIGYVEIHLHRVNRNEKDVEDVSAGVTVRINPKAKK